MSNAIKKDINKIGNAFKEVVGEADKFIEKKIFIQLLQQVLLNEVRGIFTFYEKDQQFSTFYNTEYSFSSAWIKFVRQVPTAKRINETQEQITSKVIANDTARATALDMPGDIYLTRDKLLETGGKRAQHIDVTRAIDISIATALPREFLRNKNISTQLTVLALLIDHFFIFSWRDTKPLTSATLRNRYHDLYMNPKKINEEKFKNSTEFEALPDFQSINLYAFIKQFAYLMLRYYDLSKDFAFVLNGFKLVSNKSLSDTEILFVKKITDQVVVDKLISPSLANLKLKESGLTTSKSTKKSIKVGFKEIVDLEMRKEFGTVLQGIWSKWK